MDSRNSALIEITRTNLRSPKRGYGLRERELWLDVALMKADFEDYLRRDEVDTTTLRRWAEVSGL